MQRKFEGVGLKIGCVSLDFRLGDYDERQRHTFGVTPPLTFGLIAAIG